jgi:hypothetical protein
MIKSLELSNFEKAPFRLTPDNIFNESKTTLEMWCFLGDVPNTSARQYKCG